MTTVNRAGKNILLKAISEISSRLIYLFFFIYMARKLGASDFGLFSFAFSFAGIFVILVDPGLNILLTRDVARERSLTKKYCNNIFSVKALLSIIIYLLLWSAIVMLGYNDHTIRVVLVMGVFLILNCFLDYFVSISNAYEKMEIDAVIKIANKFFVSVFGGAALLAGNGINSVIAWMIAGSVIAVLLGYYLIRKVITSITIEFEWHFIRRILITAFPVALTMVFSIIYFKVDVVMLSMFKVSNAEIGLYSAAIKLIETLNVIPAIFVGGIFPILASLSEKSKRELESTFVKSYKILLLIAVPIVISTATFSNEIIGLIYGDGYANSAAALRILIWASLFIFPHVLLSNVIVVINRQKLNAVFACFCLFLNISLNFFLIPRYGIIGAGYATVVTDMFFCILCIAVISVYVKDTRLITGSVKPVVCGVLLALILTGLDGLNLVFLLPIGITSYFISIFITKTLSIEDLLQVKRAFIRR